MCEFLSFVTDKKGDVYFFDLLRRKELKKLAEEGSNNTKTYSIDDFDSHSSICSYFNLNVDKVNKYEYYPFAEKFKVDQLNIKDDSKKAEARIRKQITLAKAKKLAQYSKVSLVEIEIRTFEDACKVLSLDPVKSIPDFSCMPEMDNKAMIAHAKIVIIVRAANQIDNQGKIWEPDWDNSSEYKYQPYFYYGSSGFSYYDCANWHSRTTVGSRLAFRNREVAIHITTQFLDLYKEYFEI